MWYIYLGIAIVTVFLALIIDLEVSPVFFYCPTCGKIAQWATMASKQSFNLECSSCKTQMERRYIPSELYKSRRKIWVIPTSIVIPSSATLIYLALTMRPPYWGSVVYFSIGHIFVMIVSIIYFDSRIKNRVKIGLNKDLTSTFLWSSSRHFQENQGRN
ncbi:MAG: hypothetical protein HWN65_11645 [Candidatus Helarchaeota archaeon]|nr:hypothetical protein [Candidatus Helarchaeota archaeon]